MIYYIINNYYNLLFKNIDSKKDSNNTEFTKNNNNTEFTKNNTKSKDDIIEKCIYKNY